VTSDGLQIVLPFSDGLGNRGRNLSASLLIDWEKIKMWCAAASEAFWKLFWCLCVSKYKWGVGICTEASVSIAVESKDAGKGPYGCFCPLPTKPLIPGEHKAGLRTGSGAPRDNFFILFPRVVSRRDIY
jgi:hypothetical protein